MRAVQTYHVKSNGWNDIGYNFLVDPFGQIFEGRGGGMTRNVIGAHAEGFNTGSVGIAVLGSYGSTAPTKAAKDALARLIAWRLDLAHVDPTSSLTWTSQGGPKYPAGTAALIKAVNGHGDVGATACPGAKLKGAARLDRRRCAGTGRAEALLAVRLRARSAVRCASGRASRRRFRGR